MLHIRGIIGSPEDGEETRKLHPSVLSSRHEYPWEVTADASFVGGKAVGLFLLPTTWIPPFVVLTRNFCSQWSPTHKSRDILTAVCSADRAMLADFLCVAQSNSVGSDPRVLVRSNGPLESAAASRGCYPSYPVVPDLDEVLRAVDLVLESSYPEPMCVIIQIAVSPGRLGHMSNERRVSSTKTRWLLEGLGRRASRSKQEYLQAETRRYRLSRVGASESQSPLVATTEAEVRQALRLAASLLIWKCRGYLHCEWVWDGKRVWIVQLDCFPEADSSAYYASSYLGAPVEEEDESSSGTLEILNHYRAVADERWRKLRRPRVFHQLGMPTADVYLFPAQIWHDISPNLRQQVTSDLSMVLRHNPVVVRCDLDPDAGLSEDFLPTSGPLSTVEQVLSFMRTTEGSFLEQGTNPAHWAFLISPLVPARACAMAQAFPDGSRVRVDALWGFPDGLLYFPHDSYFYVPQTGKIDSVVRFKGLCRLHRDGRWTSDTIGPPHDWKDVLSAEEVQCIASWAQTLASNLGHQVQLMALARIGGRRGASACLPWHYTDMDIKEQLALSELPMGLKVRAISNDADVTAFEALNGRGIDAYLIQPQPELARNVGFIKRVAELSACQDKILYFEGSLLGHAYYMMCNAGAKVVPIISEEPKSETKLYSKLVRDEIPVVIARAGGLARVRTLQRDQAQLLLKQKLIEEALELWGTDTESVIEELADIIEVVAAIREQYGISAEALEAIRDTKRKRRGGFERLIYLEETTVRPLSIAMDEGGSLPLIVSDDKFPGPAATGDRPLLRVDNTDEGARTLTISLPLVPPVRSFAPLRTLKVTTGAWSVEAVYIGAEVSINIERSAPPPPKSQLSLFDG